MQTKKTSIVSLKQPTISKKNFQRYKNDLSIIIKKGGDQKGLSPKQEISLAKKIKKGDHQALEELVMANLRFVINIAKKYQGQGLPLADLISAGNLGLIKAAQNFDETRGFKFISYAVWWVRESILLALANESRVIRIPVSRIAKIIKVNQSLEYLTNKFNRKPNIKELTDHTKLTANQVSESLINFNPFVSLNQPVNFDDKKNLLNILSDSQYEFELNQSIFKESLHREINQILSHLNEREAQIIKLYHGIDQETHLSFEDIGTRMNLSRERIQQIYDKEIRRLRKKPSLQYLKFFLK